MFQLTSGQLLNFLSAPLAMITGPLNALLGDAQGQAGSAQNMFQGLFGDFSDNISSQIDFGLGQFDFLNGNGTNACYYNLTQQYYAIGNQTRE